jgi:hypothetical protein
VLAIEGLGRPVFLTQGAFGPSLLAAHKAGTDVPPIQEHVSAPLLHCSPPEGHAKPDNAQVCRVL